MLVGLALPPELDRLNAALHRFWESVDGVPRPHPESRSRMAFELGVTEIATNIVRYAYPTHPVGELEVRLQLYADRLEAQLLDRGQPFEEPAASAHDPEVLREGGFGLIVTRRALDLVEYSRSREGRNCWRLVKRFDVDGEQPA